MFINENNMIELESQDICMSCLYFINWNSPEGKLCPMLKAIGYGDITLRKPDREMYLTNCDFFKKQEKRLKVVKD